jgi:hypothetical protein
VLGFGRWPNVQKETNTAAETDGMKLIARTSLVALTLLTVVAFASSASANSGNRPEIAAGAAHTCALADNGKVKCWGAGAAGQLGIGSTADATEPTEIVPAVTAAMNEQPSVPVLGRVEAIAAAAAATCAISGGTIWCWGSNASGQLGLGTVDDDPHSTPQQIPGSKDFYAITAGPEHFCATTWQGELSCWGANSAGQIGNGSVGGAVPSPSKVAGLKKFKSIAAGGTYSCVVLYYSHKPSCWGDGDGTPREVAGVEDAYKLAAGAASVCSIGWTETAVNCWPGGAVGAPTGVAGLFYPEAFGGTATSTCVVAKTVTAATSVPITKTRSLQCWGDNTGGQLGTGDSTSSSTPRLVNLADVASLSVGSAAARQCAIVRGGDPYCWGSGVLVPTRVEGLDLVTKAQYPDWASVKPLSRARWNKRRTAKRISSEVVIQPSPFSFAREACAGRIVGSVQLPVKEVKKGKKASTSGVTYKRVGARTTSKIYRSAEGCKAKLTFSIPRAQYKRNSKKLLLKASSFGNKSMAAFSTEFALKDLKQHLKSK